MAGSNDLMRGVRIRLECLSEAVASYYGTLEPVTVDDILTRARRFERYVKGPAYEVRDDYENGD